MSFDTTISTTLKLNGVEAYLAGLQSARAATQAMSGLKGTITIDDGAAKAKVAGVTSEVQKLSAAKATPSVKLTGADEAVSGLSKVKDQIQQVREIGVLGAEFAAVGLGLAKIVEPAAGVQQNLKDIQILSGATASEVAKLGEAATHFTDLGVGSNEATSAMVELARAGVSVADSASIAKDAVALGTAGQIDAASAANALTNTLHAFNLANSESTRVSNLYAGAANASSATTQDLIQAMSQAGQGAQSMGQSVDDTLTTLAIFADRGLKGSDAGTSLRTMLLRLVPQSAQAKEAMAALGLSFQDSTGKILPMAAIAQQLQDKLGGLSEAQRTQALQTIFGTDAFRAANILVQQGSAAYTQYGAAIGRVTALQDAEKRQDTLTGSIAKSRAEWENLRVTFGTAMIPTITALASTLGTLANAVGKAPPEVINLTADLLLLAAAIKAVTIAGSVGEVLSGGKAAEGAAGLLGGASKVGKAKVAVDAAVTVEKVEAGGAIAAIQGGLQGIMAAAPPILLGLTVGVIIAKTVEIPEANKLIDKKAIDTINKKSVLLQSVRGQTDRLNSDSQEQLNADKDIILANLKNSVDQAQQEMKEYTQKKFDPSTKDGLANIAAQKLGFVDPHLTQLQYQIDQSTAAYNQAANHIAAAFNDKVFGPPLPDDAISKVDGIVKSAEQIKAEAADATEQVKQLGAAFGLVDKAASGIDTTKGFAGIAQATPAIREAAAALKDLGVKDVGLDKLAAMADALGVVNKDLQDASAAFNGFQAQAQATDQSISAIDSYKKGLTEVYDAAKKAQSAGVATPDQLELVSKYTAIVGNLDGMVSKLQANKAGDFLNMAKNFPDLIKYDDQLRKLTDKFGGAAALQIQLQLHIDEAKADNEAQSVLAGIKDKTAPLYQTIEVAVSGDQAAQDALKRIRDGEEGIPAQKDVKIIASALGISDLDTMSRIISGINDKHVDITASVTVSGGGLPDLNIPAPGGIDPARGYASGGVMTGDYAIVGDGPGGRITPYTEVIDRKHGRIYSNAQSRAMGFFGKSGIPHYAEGDGAGGGNPIGTIDLTNPGVVNRQYGGPGTGVLPPVVDPVKVAAGTTAVKEQTQAIIQEKDKLIDATEQAAALADRIAGLDSAGVARVAQAFQSVYDWAKKANEAAIIKGTGKDASAADALATVAADKQAAGQAVDFAVAYAQALDKARDPAADLSKDFDNIRASGGPMAENAIRYISIQREMNVSAQTLADLQQKSVDLERAHTQGAADTAAAVQKIQDAQKAEQDAEQAAATARDRANTRDGWQRDKARTDDQRAYDAATQNRQDVEEGLQRKWAAEQTVASHEKQIRDAAWAQEQRQEADTKTASDQAWTLEQRQFQDKQTAQQRYGSAALQGLKDEKTALDDLHKTQAGQLSAQGQLLGALAQSATDSQTRIGLSLQSAFANQAAASEQTRYQAAIDANTAATDAETKRAAKEADDLQDQITTATRAHEDEVARIAAENEAKARAHDDEENRIALEQQALQESHALTLQQMQDADKARDRSRAIVMQQQADDDKARTIAYQEESWRITDVDKQKADASAAEVKRLQEDQKTADAKYDKDKQNNDDLIKQEQAKIDKFKEQQSYLDNVMSLWSSLYTVAGDTANRILTVLQGGGVIGASPGTSYTGTINSGSTYTRNLGTGKAGGGPAMGLFKAGERGEEWVYADGPVTVMPHMAVEAAKAAGTGTGGVSIGQVGPFTAAQGETWDAFSRKVLDVIKPWWDQNSPAAIAAMTGIR